MSILTVENIHKSYFGKEILRGVSFSLDRGDRLALIGDNGSGKSTLLRIIAGKEKADPESGRVCLASTARPAMLEQELERGQSGSLALDDPEMQKLEQAFRRVEAAMAADPQNSRLLQEYTTLSAKFEALGAWDFEHNLAAALAGLGLEADVLGRPVSALSGGEQMRVKLARILVKEPDLLLLDEPTNHMDVAACEWLEAYLARYKGSLIVVSHDRRFLDRVATQIAELDEGKLSLFSGNYTDYLRIREENLFRLKKEEKKLRDQLDHESEVAQTMLSHRKMTSYHSREKKVRKLSEALTAIKSQTRQKRAPFSLKLIVNEDHGDPRRTLIEATNLSVQFPDSDVPLFKPLDLRIRGQEKKLIVGPNGCGKSNLIRALAAQNPWLTGDVRLSANLQMAFLDQWVRFADESLSVIEELRSRQDLTVGQAREVLASFGFFDSDLEKKIQVLSGGEKSRLALSCILQENPELLFLDEPSNHLDIKSREILEKALENYKGSILAVSHDRYFIDRIAEEVWGYLDGGFRPFPTYDAYRRAVQAEAAATAENKAANPFPEQKATVSAKGEKTPLSENKNSPSAQTAEKGSEPEFKQSGRVSLSFSSIELALLPQLKKIPLKPANKSEERRYRAQMSEALKQCEDEIALCEKQSAELESQFGQNDSSQLYEDYAKIHTRLEAMTELYFKLGVACESDT